MIYVGSNVLVKKNLTNSAKYDTSCCSSVEISSKYSFAEGKKGVVVSIDKSSTYPYQVRFGDAKSVRVRKQDLLLIN